MIVDHSYGIIPLCKHEGQWQVLLIQHGSALYWGFPKGHLEAPETPQQAAIRELKEETNLQVCGFFSDIPLEEHYMFRAHGQMVNKTVSYFLAEVTGELKLQREEVSDGNWFSLSDALQQLTYTTDKRILTQVIAKIDEI